jgi:hypothetical protein
VAFSPSEPKKDPNPHTNPEENIGIDQRNIAELAGMMRRALSGAI